jgi:autotransporter strand-loop-strand O-heptosyltransferase
VISRPAGAATVPNGGHLYDSSAAAASQGVDFSNAASVPTQTGPQGIRFDFNDGCRVLLPDGKWHVRLLDLDMGNVLYEADTVAGHINTTRRYYCRIRIEVWAAGQTSEPVLRHDYSAKERDVLVQIPAGAVGDAIGWFPYAVKFQEKHGCRLSCVMWERLIPLFRDKYPHIRFLTREQVRPEEYYATYNVGLFDGDYAFRYKPCDFRLVGIHRTAGYLLGVDPAEVPPLIALHDDSRPLSERYVCIAVQGSSHTKNWTNPHGWHEIVAFLKEAGYRVICVDHKRAHGSGMISNHIPHGVEDETGLSLSDSARWIKHAEFFVGLSSGLSWLAWAVNTPVVMISGFTHPVSEFHTPYRVINFNVCNSCFNDANVHFNPKDFTWCPRHAYTPRQLECSRLITAEAVKEAIRRVPAFREK